MFVECDAGDTVGASRVEQNASVCAETVWPYNASLMELSDSFRAARDATSEIRGKEMTAKRLCVGRIKVCSHGTRHARNASCGFCKQVPGPVNTTTWCLFSGSWLIASSVQQTHEARKGHVHTEHMQKQLSGTSQ